MFYILSLEEKKTDFCTVIGCEISYRKGIRNGVVLFLLLLLVLMWFWRFIIMLFMI
jgi:hypothetical protein